MATPTHPSAPSANTRRPDLIPLEVLLGDPERTAPALSPDGRRVAWLAPHEGMLNVWVRDLGDPPGHDRVVTDACDRGIASFRWSADGTRILYIQDNGGDERWQLFAVQLATGDRRELTPPGVAAYLLAVSDQHPDTILVGLTLDSMLHDVYRLHLDTAELTKIVENPGFVGFLADHDLRVRAAMAPTPDGGMVILARDTEQTAWRPLLHVGREDALTTVPLAFSGDGTRLLCLTSHEADASRLMWIDMATGDRDILHTDLDHDVTGVFTHPTTHTPRLAYVQGDRLEAVALDASIKPDLDVLAGLGGDLQILGSDTADQVWLIAAIHDDEPTHYYLYHRDTGHTERLFTDRPALTGHTLARMEPITVTARDGLTLHGYATFPPGEPRKNLPTVLLIHGGPWHRDTWGFHPEAQWLANLGCLALQVNFRGSTGYGKAFLNAGDKQWGAAMHDDLIDTLAYAIEHGWADPARIAAYGSSYGGYAALCGAAFTPGVFRCAVAHNPPTNLAAMISAIPAYAQPIIDQAHRRIGHTDTDADLLWSRSPLAGVDDIRIPLLITQGANDPRIPKTDTDAFVDALRLREKSVVYRVVGGEGHHVSRSGERVAVYHEAEQFLAEYLGLPGPHQLPVP